MKVVLLDIDGNPVSEELEVAPGEDATFSVLKAPAVT